MSARPAGREPAPPRQGVRLTRRGRVVLVAFAAGVLLVALWLTVGRGALAGSDDGSAGEGGVRAATASGRTVVVGPGDTLWDIAVGIDPRADPRPTVQRIIDLNGLGGGLVQPGRELRLPVG